MSMADMNLQARALLQYRIEQFYFDEAAALDEWRYDDWVALFTDDTRYWMPVRRTRAVSELGQEFSRPGDVAYFDDTKDILLARVRKLKTGLAWAEDPPSRTRRLLTNIRVLGEEAGDLKVSCNFQLFRSRLDSEEESWVGRREDLLRPDDDGFRIARRAIYLEQTVLLSRNLSNFF